MKLFIITLCYLTIKIANGYPYGGYRSYPQPQRAVMFGGYYGQPFETRHPQGTISWAAGDTIATNSFVGEREFDVEETTERRKTIQEMPVDESGVGAVPEAPPMKPRKRPQQHHDEDDEEDEGMASGWPFGGRGYNAFFPIMFGGSGGARGRTGAGDDGGYYPGPATAIANSFSTGKGGVATSHATSFGDPYAFRNAFMNRKGKPGPQEQ